MRLCFITPEFVTEPFFSGGLANYLGRVTVALAERGHEITVLTRAQEGGCLNYRGVKVHRVVPLWDKRMVLDKADRLVPRVLYNPYQDLKAAWSLARVFKRLHARVGFDLVQAANVMGVGLFLRNVKRAPVVVRMSSYRPEWDTLAGVRKDMGVAARWLMEEWSVRGRGFVYAPSNYVASQVERAYRLPKVNVVESPFFEEEVVEDPAIYDRHCRGRDYALFFGRMTQMKGVHILARALPRVLGRHRDMRVLLVGGDAPAPGGGGMKDYVIRHAGPDADRVQTLEPLRHSQLYPVVRHARVVVLPSLVDNLPNTLLEAMGHTRVVIGTTGSCFEQLIEDGASGWLVPPGDDEALGVALSRAWTMPDEARTAMGAKAKARVGELHPERAIPRLVDYYESVLQNFMASAGR